MGYDFTNMAIEYTHGKLTEALAGAAISNAPLQKRLKDAFMRLTTLNEKDVPSDTWTHMKLIRKCVDKEDLTEEEALKGIEALGSMLYELGEFLEEPSAERKRR